jgi:TPR repeat protein
MRYILALAMSGAIAAMASIAFSVDAPDVKAAPSGECLGAMEFIKRQMDAGVELASYSRNEIQWALKHNNAQTCEPVPNMLKQRMRGEPVIIPHHVRMNCHIAFDYLMNESEESSGLLTDDDREWGREYYEAADNGEMCPEVPTSIALRARGHDIENQEMKQILAVAMDQADDGEAALEIAMAYFYGTLISKNAQKGMGYLVAAMEKGSPQAEYEMGIIVVNGKTSDMKPVEGIAYLERAASGGIVPAMMTLGVINMDGMYGAKKDQAAATKYFGMAAERGDINALIIYADRLFRGQGARADTKQAIELIRTAAIAGEPGAMTLLASFILREKDTDLLKNEGEVWYWLDKARAAGNPGAIEFYAEKADELEALYKRVKFPPPMVTVCPRVLNCDVYYYNNGRNSQKICSEGPSWRACRTVPAS